jgi:hypothetical protein
MPPILKKQVFGMPAYVWAGILAVAVTGALYYRYKHANDEGEVDPCDQESDSYDPEKCNAANPTSSSVAGYDTGDPCDPTSVTYEPAACQATAGIGYDSYNPESGYGTGLEPSPPPYRESELTGAEQGGIQIDSPLVEQIFESGPQGTPTPKRGGKCSGPRPKPKKGYRVACVGGKWRYESKAHAGKDSKKPTKNMTGGGPPHRRDNKHHKKHKKHHAHH